MMKLNYQKVIFNKAFNLVKNPKTFTTGVLARNASGESVLPESEQAVCWCSFGAIDKASAGYGFMEKSTLKNLMKENVEYKTNKTLSSFNDTESHEKVVEFWEEIGKKYEYL